MKLVLLFVALLGLSSAQLQQEWEHGQAEIFEQTEAPKVEEEPTPVEVEVEEEEAKPLPATAEEIAAFKEKVDKKEITAKELNELEKSRVAAVCTCQGNFKEGDFFEVEGFTGGESAEKTCQEICDAMKISKGKSRTKRQIGFGWNGWNAYPNFGFGGFFGGFPVGYGALGFNLAGAWGGMGGCNYGCRAMGCGGFGARGFGGCHFGCSRNWLPMPIAPMPVLRMPIRPIARQVIIPRMVPVAVPKAVPVAVPRPVNVPVIRRIDVPVPRDIPVPRPVDVPVVRRVDVPVVRQIAVARQVPVPYPIVKPIRVAVARPVAVPVPQPVSIPVQRRLIIKKRLLYRPAVARVSGVALVPVNGVAMRAGQRISGIAGANAMSQIRMIGATGGIYGSRYAGYPGIPVPSPADATAVGGGYYSAASAYQKKSQ